MNGFTLIETIIYLSIISIILSFIFLSIFNFLNYRSYYSYLDDLQKEIVFVNKKINFYLDGSNDFSITTSSVTTTLNIQRSDSLGDIKIHLSSGTFFIERNSNIYKLTNSLFDFSSSTFQILSGDKKGIKINLIGKLKNNQNIKRELEFIYYLK